MSPHTVYHVENRARAGLEKSGEFDIKKRTFGPEEPSGKIENHTKRSWKAKYSQNSMNTRKSGHGSIFD